MLHELLVIARLKEDGRTIELRVDLADRDVLLELDPRAFFVTDRRSYPAMLVSLTEVQPRLLGRLLEDAWRRQAPAHIVSRRDAGHPTPVSVVPAPGRVPGRARGASQEKRAEQR